MRVRCGSTAALTFLRVRLLEAISKPVLMAEGAYRGAWGHSLSSAETTCQSSGVGGGTVLSTWRRRGTDHI